MNQYEGNFTDRSMSSSESYLEPLKLPSQYQRSATTNSTTSMAKTSINSTKTNKNSSLSCIQTIHPPIDVPRNDYDDYDNDSRLSKLNSILSSYDKPTNKQHSSIQRSVAWNCSWSHDGSMLAVCYGNPDPCIRLFKKSSSHKPSKNCDTNSDPTNATTDDFFGGYNWSLHATLRSNTRTIRSVQFAPTPHHCRKILAAASFDGTVSIWEDFGSYSNTSDDYTLNDDYDGDLGIQRNNRKNYNKLIQTANGWECTAQLEGHENEVKDVTWNATGTLLATCGRDKSVWIWECFLPGTIGGDGTGSSMSIGTNINGGGGEGDFECLAVLHGHDGDVKSIVFAPSHNQFGDGDEILLSASYDCTIKCWAEDDGEWYCALTLSTAHAGTIWSLSVSSGGVRMVSGSSDCSLAIWRCYTTSEKNKFDSTGSGTSGGFWKCVGKLASAHQLPIYSVHCAPARVGHGRILSAGGDDCINIYREVSLNDNAIGAADDPPKFTLDATVQGAHSGDVNCARWHPLDGSLIASVGDDGLVKIWRFKAA